MHLYLAALKPPGNVEALVRPLQDHLLTHYGWTSVRALPLLLPLGYADSEDDVPPGPTTAPELVIGGVEVGGATITVPLHTPGALSPAQDASSIAGAEGWFGDGDGPAIRTGSGAPEPSQRLPRVGGGLFVGVNEGARPASEFQNLPEVAVTRVRQWWYVVIDLDYEDPESWWMHLKWREVERTRLTKREAGSGDSPGRRS